jgi:hypothetical protein
MTMFPMDWETTLSMDCSADEPPYSLFEIEDYLRRCHHHLMLKEALTTFDISGPHAQRQDAERKYWVFEARDSAKQRQWFVLVGTGTSPSEPSAKMKWWMLAKTNDNSLSFEQFLEEEYQEQLLADVRR